MEMTREMMFEFLYNLPSQFEECLGMDFSAVSRLRKDYSHIVVTGMGGSAIGGDILRCYCQRRASSPVAVTRDYVLPRFVGPGSLVLAVSYSGNTEETLAAYEQAREQGASVVAVTTGGKLAEMASRDGNPVIRIPGGLVPRAATGYLFAPLALVLEELGLVAGVREDLKETVTVLEQVRREVEPSRQQESNPAKIIAERLYGRIPVIWGCSSTSEVAAMRWKGQINENAKTLAYYNVFPELNHNEIVGFEVPQELVKKIAVVILRDPDDHVRTVKRIKITTDIIKDRVDNLSEVETRGQSFLAKVYSLIYVGDYTSVYLADMYGVNPTPVEVIDYLKNKMAE